MSQDIKDALSSMDKKVQDFINTTNEEVQSSTKLSAKSQESLKKIEDQVTEMIENHKELEQKITARGNEKEEVKSAGTLFAESDAFNNFKDGATNKARILVQNNTIVGSDAIVAPDRQSGIVGGAVRRLMIADVLPQGQTSSNAIEYTRENVFTNNAAEVAEAGAKPESSVTFALETSPVVTIAHWIKLSKQVIDDAPMIASYVDGRMRYGVALRKDAQLLNGDGTGANLSGLMNTGNHTVFTPVAASNKLENIRRAITQVEQNDYYPTAVIMNPADVEEIDLDLSGDNDFRAANPRANNARTVWGLPIVTSNTMPAGSFLLGDFAMATGLWNRQGITVDLSESDDTNFQSNLVTLRAEERCALTVYRPASLVGGLLTTA